MPSSTWRVKISSHQQREQERNLLTKSNCIRF
jgi:hypothetical protein